MGISSDIYITREEAEKLVTNILMGEYLLMVKKAINNMEDSELTSKLHCDMYFYNISRDTTEVVDPYEDYDFSEGES